MIEPFVDLMPLTDKQKAVLKAIYKYWAKHKFYPTQRELAEEFNVSLAAIQNTISQLRKKRLFSKDQGSREKEHVSYTQGGNCSGCFRRIKHQL